MKKIRTYWVIIFNVVLFSVFLFGIPCYPEEKLAKAAGKSNEIIFTTQFSGIRVQKGNSFSMDLILVNYSKRGVGLILWMDKVPEGWIAEIKEEPYRVSGVYLAPGKEKLLTFRAEPKKSVDLGKYIFVIAAKSEDGSIVLKKTLPVEVVEKKKEKSFGKIKIDIYYPVLRGSIKKKFEFSVNIENDLNKEDLFNLYAKQPDGWEINFKPAYESKYISSVKLKPKQNKVIDVEVKPYHLSPPGEYPIKVKVSTEEYEEEVQFKVIFLGSYELKLGTPDGLLTVNAEPGEKSSIKMYVENRGTAINRDITLTSFKPENWEVEFKPDRIDLLKPGESRIVKAIIKPYEGALVGEYKVIVYARGQEDSQDDIDISVNVAATPVWGYAGIGIIGFVIGGLFLMFKFFGRHK